MSNQQTGRALARKLARTVSVPFTARFWPRVEAIAAAHARQVSERADRENDQLREDLLVRVDGSARDIDRAHSRLDEVAGWHTELGNEFDKLRDRVGKLEHELSRVAAQLAAVDTRLAVAERAPVVVGGADPAQLTEATTLVDEIRTEHRRMAARLTALASYEERIGRLEEHLS